MEKSLAGIAQNVTEPSLILYRDYKWCMEARGDQNQNQMIPFLSIASREFEKDLNALKLVMNQLEKRTRSEYAYRFSEQAQMAAGWWFYDIYVTQEFLQRIFQIVIPKEELSSRDKKSAATIKIVDMFQSQMRKNGSDARVKMHGDIPFAAPWWSWLMK
jgi:hypothetical protein